MIARMIPKQVVASKWSSRTSRMYLNEGEQELILTLVDSVAPQRMIEFGVNDGRTALAVLSTITSIERYVGVDVTPDYKFELPAQSSERPQRPGHLVRHDPRFELALRSPWSTDIGIVGTFDAAFIDGDHGYHAVQKDYALAKTIVRSGGIIIFHDYNNAAVSVTEALDDLYRDGADLKHVDGTWLVFERL